MENRPWPKLQMEPAKAPMQIVEHSRSPMVARSESDLNISNLQRFPRNQFVNSIKSKVMHEVPNAVRHNDRLPRGNSSQSSPIQMVKMGVCYQYKVDRRQMVQREAGTTNAFNDLQPERP